MKNLRHKIQYSLRDSADIMWPSELRQRKAWAEILGNTEYKVVDIINRRCLYLIKEEVRIKS